MYKSCVRASWMGLAAKKVCQRSTHGVGLEQIAELMGQGCVLALGRSGVATDQKWDWANGWVSPLASRDERKRDTAGAVVYRGPGEEKLAGWLDWGIGNACGEFDLEWNVRNRSGARGKEGSMTYMQRVQEFFIWAWAEVILLEQIRHGWWMLGVMRSWQSLPQTPSQSRRVMELMRWRMVFGPMKCGVSFQASAWSLIWWIDN